MVDYKDGHEQILRKALYRIRAWPDENEILPKPSSRHSGRAERSTVYSIYLPRGNAEGILYIAKFDDLEKAELEWKAINELRGINLPPEILLPVSKNELSDGVIIFPAASGIAGLRETMSLDMLFRNQCEVPMNCMAALDKLFFALDSFYTGQSTAPAHLPYWHDAYPELKKPENVRRILDAANAQWPGIQWDVESEFALSEMGAPVRRCPNPFVRLDALLQQTTGRVKLSRIHGDLNLTNVLVSLEDNRNIHRVFVIDVPNCKSNQIQAIDFAKIEVEIWYDLLANLCENSRDDALTRLVLIRDFLDGREKSIPEKLKAPYLGLLKIVNHLRLKAAIFLRTASPNEQYVFRDYMRCIYFGSLNALRYPDVSDSVPKTRAMIVSAALALAYINEIEHGLYLLQPQQRWVPPREIPSSSALSPDYYAAVLLNFRTEYLGTSKHPVPFGGRKAYLTGLDTWLDDPSAPHYLLLVARTGLGKSALLVHWHQQLLTRDAWAVVFFSVSIRFSTNLINVFFASITAQLAVLHKEEAPRHDTPVQELRWMIANYLSRSLPDERRLLLIVDGVDEARGWEIGPGFFPLSPPENLRVVVSARQLAGDKNAGDWLRRLGWDHDHSLARIQELDPLSQKDVADVLKCSGFSLDHLATQVDVVAELYRRSKGDPLLVRLYVELWAWGAKTGRLLPEDLRDIRPGLEGYFERWWKEQHKLWGDKTPLREKETQTLLSLLAFALGPLSQDDVLHLAPQDAGLNTWTLPEILRPLERLIIGDGRHQGYIFSYPGLGIYFYDKLSASDRQVEQSRFLAWGKKTLVALNEGQLAPDKASPHIVQYYAGYLERAGNDPGALMSLVSNGWQRAWYKLEGIYAGFLNDVRQARRGAEKVDDAEAEAGRPLPRLGSQIRCALCSASINSLADFPPALLEALVRAEKMQPAQALAYALQGSDEERQTEALALLAPHLPKPLEWAFAYALERPDERQGATSLASVAAYLSPLQMKRTLTAVKEMNSSSHRLIVLEAIAPHLPYQLTEPTWKLAQEIPWDTFTSHAKAKTLAALVGRRAQLRGHEATFRDVQALPDGLPRVLAIAALLLILPNRNRSEILLKAFRDAWQIKDRFFKGKALVALAAHVDYLEEPQRNSMLENARETIEGYGDNLAVRLLMELVQFLPQHERAFVLERTRAILEKVADHSINGSELRSHLAVCFAQIGDVEEARALTFGVDELTGLIPYLSGPARETVINECREAATAASKEIRLTVLATISRYLPPEEGSRVLEDALAEVRVIEDSKDREKALAGLVPVLAECGDWQAAQTKAAAILDSKLKTEALMNIAVHVPKDRCLGVVQNFLETAREIDSRDEVLAGLALRLAEIGREDGALVVMRELSPTNSKHDAVGKVALLLAKRGYESGALEAVGLIWDPSRRPQLLAKLAPCLSLPVLQHALNAARQDTGSDEALASLAARYAGLGDHDTALAEARAIDDQYWQVKALLNILPHLPEARHPEVLREARNVAHGVKRNWAKADALASLAQFLDEPARREAMIAIEAAAYAAISEGNFPGRAITVLGQKQKTSLLSEALREVLSDKSAYTLTPRLKSILPYLSKPLLDVAEKKILKGITNDYEQDMVRAEILIRLGELGHSDEMLAKVREMTRVELKTEVLAEAGQYLDSAQRDEALEIVREFEKESWREVRRNENYQALALEGLAPYLSDEQSKRALVVVQVMREDNSHWRDVALTALATRLKVLPLNSLYSLWKETLPVLANRTRAELLGDLRSLAPVIGALGGVAAIAQTCEAIQELGDWSWMPH